ASGSCEEARVSHYVELIRPDGRRQRFPLGAEPMTIGRSDAASVPVPDAPELEPLHLLVAPRAEGCWVSVAREARVPALLSGSVLEHGLVEWGSEIDVGALTVRVSSADADRDRRGSTLGVVLVAISLLAAAPVLAGGLLGGSGELPRPAAPPPALFSDGAPSCPGRGEAAGALGRAAHEAALARAERYAFDP